jgi:hypothetical protein
MPFFGQIYELYIALIVVFYNAAANLCDSSQHIIKKNQKKWYLMMHNKLSQQWRLLYIDDGFPLDEL